mmetsp:Transcript_7644/g.7861  ORF Transcript_7644/g.7861 Transcript_7644/m.7861 type:complete len:221 (+) Transcript_7644:164-826(+)
MSGKKRKGLSAEDKRAVILKIYHDKKEPLNLKEIESLASKLGVVHQTVKEHNQSLVDDGLVLTDKIGSSNFYWSFPSKASRDKVLQKETIQSTVESLLNSITSYKLKINEARKTRIDGSDRDEKMRQLLQLQLEDKHLSKELEKEAVNDPEEIHRIQSLATVCKNSCDRWTDNIWNIKRYLTKKKGMSGKEVDKMLFINGAFDYYVYEHSGRKSRNITDK